jgi:hypothetical protein
MSSNKKRARVSEVWKHFTPIGDADDPYTCLCKLCRESIPRSSTETTTLWSHLSKMHTAQHAVLKGKDLKQRKLTRPSSSFLSNLSSSSSSPSSVHVMTEKDRAHADELLATAVVACTWSFRSIERSPFKRFVHFVSRGTYEPPSRKKLTGVTMDNYQHMRDVLFKEVSQQMVSITTDGAVLTNGHSYVAVTGHYITADWQLRDVLLSVERADGRHDGEVVRDLLDAVQAEWSLSGRTFAAVTDNGANFVKGVRIWSHISERLRCSIHTLQLALKDAVNPKKESHLPYWVTLIKKVRSLVKKVRMSTLLSQSLRTMQKEVEKSISTEDLDGLEDEDGEEAKQPNDGKAQQQGRKEGHLYSLVVDVCTRFNSICLVFRRLILLRREVTALCAQESDLEPFALTEDEWTAIEGATLMLNRAKELCDILEHSTVPTVSLMLPLIDSLVTVLNGTYPSILDVTKLHPRAKELTDLVSRNINTRYTSIPEFVLASIALDPRMRRSRAVCVELRNLAEHALRKLFTAPSTKSFLGRAGPGANASAAGRGASGPDVEPPGSLQELLTQRSEVPAEGNDEVTRFMQDDRSIPYAECPLQWWSKHESQYPTLAQLARAVLCVPATTAASERVFSYGSITLGTRRRHLDGERVGQLIWQQKNRKVYEALCMQLNS